MNGVRFIVAGLIATLAACAAGPSYRAPKPDLPPAFLSQVTAPGADVDLSAWWRALNDPRRCVLFSDK